MEGLFFIGSIFVSSLIHGICIQSVPWWLGQDVRVGGKISITRSGPWESIALFGIGAVENPRMLPWFLRQVHGEAGRRD